jgi:hypothetical protein
MKDMMSLMIDLKNAVENAKFDNFTVLLFRLMLKSDSENMAKLSRGFPVEVRMVEIFRSRCPYLKELADDGFRKVDFKGIALLAILEVEAGK